MNPIPQSMTEPTARRLRRGRLSRAQIRPNSIWPQAIPESEIFTMPRPRETVSAISLRRAAWTPGDEVQMEALVAACAMVAHADGWVTPEERRKLLVRRKFQRQRQLRSHASGRGTVSTSATVSEPRETTISNPASGSCATSAP